MTEERQNTDIQSQDIATLPDLFARRVALSGGRLAYRQYDGSEDIWREWCWDDVAAEVARWQQALLAEGLARGARVAIMLPNGVPWIVCDQAALGLGLVVVPIFSHDNAGNVEYILRDSGSEILVTDRARFSVIANLEIVPTLKRIVVIDEADSPELPNVVALDSWLVHKPDSVLTGAAPDDIATLVYTSGTTGAPKGVVLTHHNLLSNAVAVQKSFPIGADNLFLSFLPLSHIFERTAGYYMTMLIGVEVAFARSIQHLKEDMLIIKPTVMFAVPRIFEGMLEKLNASLSGALTPLRRLLAWVSAPRHAGRHGVLFVLARTAVDRLIGRRFRKVFGGRMRYMVSGGAALSPDVARAFIVLGVPVYQGYGLTETAPVISVNRQHSNVPESIGPPIHGVEVKFGDGDELLTRSECVMRGYWNLPEVTAQAIDAEGWFHTGDRARIDAYGRLYIIGRIKEIIVMSNGEKVPPVDMENALLADPLFNQAMVWGEGKAFLVAILVLNPDGAASCSGDTPSQADGSVLADDAFGKEVMKRVSLRLKGFPSYAKVRRVIIAREPWTVENGFLTPTLKLKRHKILEQLGEQIESAYRSIW